MERYAKNAGAVCRLNYHDVWCQKYRRAVLGTPVDRRLKALLHGKADELGLTIHTLDVRPDPVQLLVEADPTRCVAEIVNRLKGDTSHVLREECPSRRSRLPTLWSRCYYASSVGSVREAVIRRDIEGQQGT